MKKLLTTIALLGGATCLYSQGVIDYADYNWGPNGFNIHIWSPNPANPSVEQTGNSSVPFVANGQASSLMGILPLGQ
jgi:hypothetical protein